MRNCSMIFSSSPPSQPLDSGTRLHKSRQLPLMSRFSLCFGSDSCFQFPDNRWVWTSQMIYDVRYETGDLPHRFFKALQLFVLGMNPDKTPSDLKPESQHLQEGLMRILALSPILDWRAVQQTHLNIKQVPMHSADSRSHTSSADLSSQYSTHWSTTVPARNHIINETISCLKLPPYVLAGQCGSSACLWKETMRQVRSGSRNSDSGMAASSSKSWRLLSACCLDVL